MITDSLSRLAEENKLNKSIVLWGIGSQTGEVIAWLRSNGYGNNILFIADNFKCTFYREYEGIPVVEPYRIRELDKASTEVILSINYSDSVRRQLEAYGVTESYNLRNLSEGNLLERCNLPYHFTDRSKGKKYLCYVLAGYEPVLWDSTLARIEAYQDSRVDYCLVSSGKYVPALDKLAEKNGWSYLHTEQNQVCFIQNLAVELHPEAEYIWKLDEDIFIGKDFFGRMIQEYHRIEQCGEYRIGFLAPVIPLNCCGYVSYLNLCGKREEYEKRFGRAYRSRFSAVFNVVETAEFFWDTMDTFDDMAQRFLRNEGSLILDCYYNIGCIMFSRERWLMMGKWPEKPGESGMGRDEAFIYQDNVEKDLSIYEAQGVLAGHLAFGHQKERMLAYYHSHPEKFRIASLNE